MHFFTDSLFKDPNRMEPRGGSLFGSMSEGGSGKFSFDEREGIVK